jgi:antitoxin PrlF
MPKSTVTSKGQVTIPIEVRNKLGIEAGDELLFRVEEDDKLSVYPLRSAPARSLAGALKRYAPKEPISIEDMNQAIRGRAVDRHKRSDRPKK